MSKKTPPVRTIKRALISVSDKTGVIEFARKLKEFNVKILSTGGTAKLLADNGIAVTEVADVTQFPEIMDGRVKTLHPRIHGALLGRRGIDEAVMDKHDIVPIDLLVVNLYPFENTVAKPNCSFGDAIENIDIGGPTMLRAAAKNHDGVTVITNASDYDTVTAEMDANKGGVTYATRYNLAIKAFEHTAAYDGAISNYFGCIAANGDKSDFPNTFNCQLDKVQEMRYGENPHQKAAFYKEKSCAEASVSTAVQLQGKELSYNNVADTDAALECVKSFSEPACVIVKHANPCGVAVADNLFDAYDYAHQTDPTSAFGGIIAFNKALDGKTAKEIIDRQFVEVIIAPVIPEDVREILAAKQNIRVLECGEWQEPVPAYDYKRVNGGLLVQDRDLGVITADDLKIVSSRVPTEDEMRDLLFAWKVGKFVKSNAIVYCKNNRTIGVGAGQMSRVYSAKIASIKAEDEKLEVKGSVMASDAFFPFRDGIDSAAVAGITAVIQPGGSIRDEEIIAAADEAGMAMVFTGMRHFRH